MSIIEFEDLAKNRETNDINDELIKLYNAWNTQCVSKLCDKNVWTYPTLLKCTDSYLQNRVMLFGKEENSQNTGISDFITSYQNNWPSFEYMSDIVSDKARKTRFLDVRKILCIDYNKFDPIEIELKWKSLSNVLVNNLNKISINGKSKDTPLIMVRNLFRKFTFGDDSAEKTVFHHELDILEPKKIILACGPSYIDHIVAAFPIEKDELKKYRPTYTTMVQDISSIFNLKGCRVFWTYHPAAFFTVDQRKKYIKEIVCSIVSGEAQ